MTAFLAKVTSKGQVTIPVEIRLALGINDGEKVEFALLRSGEAMILARNKPASAIFGLGAKYTKPINESERQARIGRAIAERGKSKNLKSDAA